MSLLLWASLALAGDPLLDVLQGELTRSQQAMEGQDDAPYYTALQVEERDTIDVLATSGALVGSEADRVRWLDVDLRVGTPELDSTHPLRGMSGWRDEGRERTDLPLDDDPHAISHAIWRVLDRTWRDHAERIQVVQSTQRVKVEEEDPAPDFEVREAVVAEDSLPDLSGVDQAAWEDLLTRVSERLDASPVVQRNQAMLRALVLRKRFVDTEGTRLTHGVRNLRVALTVSAVGPDGDGVDVYRYRDMHDPQRLPDEDELMAWADGAVAELEALLAAPRGEPYSGPVLLKGRAAGVFFHEVFGHRVEGHRQKRDWEGKTFKDMVGEQLLPDFIDIVDDPTVAQVAGKDLNGHYAYDDEGVPAAPAPLVEDGVFVGFLLHRSPIQDFPHTNGHGRRMAGNAPVSRMANTLIHNDAPVPFAELRKQLKRQIRDQGLPYGLMVEEIDGGFTLTGRVTPNAFNVRAGAAWKVFPDDRPDELVRGVDLVGTPLEAFGNLVAAGDDYDVFNGQCGAESGWVLNSAVAPSILLSSMEFQRKEKGEDRPPLLEKPMTPDGAADAEVLP